MPLAEKIYYFSFMADDHPARRPPVILIHGAGGNYLTWPPQIRRLAGQRIFALDLAGHGKSEVVGRQSIEDYVSDVLAFMKSLHLHTAILAGISMGSGIALELALQEPKRAAALVLLGSGAKMRVAPATLESLENAANFESVVESINENCFSAAVSQQVRQLSRKTMMETRPAVLLGDYLACDHFDATQRLAQIQIPTLMISGAEDKMTPAKYARALAGSIRGAQFEVLDGAGHLVMVEQPRRVAELMMEFIERHFPAAARRSSAGR